MVLVLVAFSYGMNHTSYLIWGAFCVAPVLLILSLPVAARAARTDGDAIGRIVLVGAAVKILVTPLLRYGMAFVLYGGSSDAFRYHDAGVLLAPLFRHGIYRDLGQISGTRFMEILTGQVYAVTGPTSLGGFMVFSWFAFLGCYLFFRAFRTAYPEADGRRYALLVFFFPTLLFWPSSIGKEAFMLLVLGAMALGIAQLLAGRFRGLLWLAPGLWGGAVVRPHMAFIVGAGLVIAAAVAVFRGGQEREGRGKGRLGGAVLVLTLVLAGPTLMGFAEQVFQLDSVNGDSAQKVLDVATRQTSEGGSAFTAISPRTPVGFILAGATVLFRPMPFEAHNAQALLSSLEGVALFGLCAVSLRRVARLPHEALRRPYAAFAAVYTFAFLYAFSSINNFGILARQRAQLLPILFVVLCLPTHQDAAGGEPLEVRRSRYQRPGRA